MFRSLAALLALTFVLPVAASAQVAPPAPVPPAAGAPGAPPAQHHHNPYMAALRTLALTPDQKQQIRGLVRATRAANQGADRATKHANVKKLRSDIEALLTPDQRTQLHATLVQQRTNPPAQ